jgi:hypothetical protein
MRAGRDRDGHAGPAATHITNRPRSDLQTTDRPFVGAAVVNSIVILTDVPIKNRG